jgi:hypothetical protein
VLTREPNAIRTLDSASSCFASHPSPTRHSMRIPSNARRHMCVAETLEYRLARAHMQGVAAPEKGRRPKERHP